MTVVERKLAALEKIYAAYGAHTAELETACAKGCTPCCSTDVTISTLEGYHLWRRLASDKQDQLARRLEKSRSTERFRPAVTINQLAEICAAEEDSPEEEKTGRQGSCPLISEDLCTVYPLRPFHCRCMFSRRVCRPSGCAEMDDFTLTINSVFLQVIEHLDTPGCTGNLLDVLALMRSREKRQKYESGRWDCRSDDLLPNRPLTKLMIPPEYLGRMTPILKELHRIQI